MKKIAAAMVLLFCASCRCASDTEDVVRTATQAGFTNVRVGDLDFFECGREDATGRSFTATNPSGGRTQGVVCCGTSIWGKGCTIRY